MSKKAYYNRYALMRVAASRGYDTVESVVHVFSKLFGIGYDAASEKFYEDFLARMDESFALAGYFEMTPAEYCDCFLHGLFLEKDGHWVASVDDVYMALPGNRAITKRWITQKAQMKRSAARKEQQKEALAEKARAFGEDDQ